MIAIIGIFAELLLPTLGKVRVSCEAGSLHEQLEAGSIGDEHVVLNNEDYLPLHRRSSFAPGREKWEDSIATFLFMDVQWHHTLWDGYLDRNTNVFQCAANSKMGKVLKHWRDKHDEFVGWEIAESYKEWNWSYGWNAAGEGSRENALGTVPA